MGGYNWRQSCDKSTVKLLTTVAFCDMLTVEISTVDKSTVYFSTSPQHMARFVQFRSISSSILNMPFHVCHQLSCSNGCIATLVAFIWLFSTVGFQMSPQSTWVSAGIFTLVAFVRLFSGVCFQMCPQMVRPRGCIITLVAFVWLFSTVCFQMCPQIGRPRRWKVTMVAFI